MEFVGNIVDYVNGLIGESYLKPRVIILLIVLFIFGLYLFLSMKLGNLSQNAEKKITDQYDKIFYLWSIYYHDHMDSLNVNPGLIVLKAIWGSGKSKYIPNRELIQENILKIEKKLGKKIIPEENWECLGKLFKKYKTKKIFSNILKWIIILIIIFLILLLLCVVFGH